MSWPLLSTNDVIRPGVKCAHCGMQLRGFATVNGQKVCHTDPPYPDCYRLITVYGETLGARRVGHSPR